MTELASLFVSICMILFAEIVCYLALQIIDPPENSLTLSTGDNLTLTCLGDNAAVIAWYRSGQLVTLANDEISFERDLDSNRQKALMTRPLVTSSESGEYQCRDQTKHLNDSRIIIVHVTSTSELAASIAGMVYSHSYFTHFKINMPFSSVLHSRNRSLFMHKSRSFSC
jgi:hypothetical protein